ncbi:MAG: hypothetical protein ACOY71_00735 [Gemmatimonadota bacterium]
MSALRTEVDALKATSEQGQSATAADLAAVRTQVAEIDDLKRTLGEVRAQLEQRNQTIAALQADLTTLKASQARIEQTDLLQRISTLESTLRRIRPGPTP